jgi:hypothetical protein
VLTQYGARSLDRTFSYLYDGPKKVGEPRYRVRIDFAGHFAMGFVTGHGGDEKAKKNSKPRTAIPSRKSSTTSSMKSRF